MPVGKPLGMLAHHCPDEARVLILHHLVEEAGSIVGVARALDAEALSVRRMIARLGLRGEAARILRDRRARFRVSAA